MNGIEAAVVYVIGCNHGIQRQEPDILDTPHAHDQRVHYRELVTSIVKEKKIQFVGEEWGLPTMTVAHAVADDNGKIPWANMIATWREIYARAWEAGKLESCIQMRLNAECRLFGKPFTSENPEKATKPDALAQDSRLQNAIKKLGPQSPSKGIM